MTTMRDWIFRAESLRMHALNLDERAEQMKQEAGRLRNMANAAQFIADEFVSAAIDNVEAATDEMASHASAESTR